MGRGVTVKDAWSVGEVIKECFQDILNEWVKAKAVHRGRES